MPKPCDELLTEIFGANALETVVFRVDAGREPGLSFGHASRCVLMARSLRRLWGTKSLFAMRELPEGMEYVRRAGFCVVAASNAQAADRAALAALKNQGGDWLVHDLPYDPPEEAIFVAASRLGARTLFWDDARFVVPAVDVVLNSNVLACSRTGDGTNARLLLGPEYFLFDEDPAGSRAGSPWSRSVLLTFGGSDPTGLSVAALQALAGRMRPGTGIRVLMGPGFGDRAEAARLARGREDVELVDDPRSPYDLFRGCDLAVCAGGRTMYELAALGKRFVAVASAAHEREPVAEFARLGLAAAGFETFEPQRLAAVVNDLLEATN